ncbi:MAG: Ig domain-containing protein [Clostridia bacterium]|nr:Ig domain-containing protein [Clostridia bacterium]
MVFLVQPDSPAVLTFGDCYINVGDFDDNNLDETESAAYKTSDGSLVLSTSSITLPKPDDTKPVTGVTLDKSELKLKVGGTYDLAETVEPTEATDKSVTYSSSNPAVATVNETTGFVTAVAVGTATITVTTKDGNKTADCAVTVYNDVAPKAEDAKIIDSTIDDLKDVDGKDVTIDPSRSYGAAKFENVDLGAYNYKIVATAAGGNEEEFEIADGDLEVSGTASFIAIVWSAKRTIASVVLRAFNN